MNRLMMMAMMVGMLKMAPEGDPGGGGGGTTPPVIPTPGSAAPEPKWYDTVGDAEIKTWAQNKKWESPEIALKSHHALEKMVGVKDKLIQVPDDLSDAKSMETIYNRLGRPEKPEGYGIKATDEAFGKWAQENFHKAGLNGGQAKGLIEGYEAFVTQMETQQAEQFKAQNEQFANELKTKWGAAHDQNLKIATAAANQFGIDKDLLGKMEQALGPAKTMEFLHSIGSKIGEAKFVEGKSAGTEGEILDPQTAKVKIDSLIKDPEWSKRYMAGGLAEKNEMEKLSKMAVGSYSA